MKYPIILKYRYSYIISGNFYKEAVREYYQLFENKDKSKMFSVDSVTDIKVNVDEYREDEIKISYKYSKYSKPNTFQHDTEWVENSYILKRGEKVTINCVEQYWAYAKGGENGLATLIVEWITYDDMLKEILAESQKDKYKAIKVANILIKEEMYDLAFKMLLNTKMPSYELGLCYEKGYGTEVDLDKALDNYLERGGYDSERGIERIFKIRGKTIKFDDVKKTIIYESKCKYRKAYSTAIIPTEMSDNTLEDMRRNVELSVIRFLELGRPFNDPFQHHTDDMSRLAIYYDMINNVSEDERPKYHTIKWENDPYDGGEFRYDIYHDDLIIETLQKEVKKNDVIALGSLLVQFGIHPTNSNFSSYLLNNLDEIIQRLIDVAENGNDKDSGMAYYFLGLYYERVAEKAQKNYDIKYYIRDKKYTYEGENIEKDLEDFLKEQNINKNNSLAELISELDHLHSFLSNNNNVNLKGDKKDNIKKIENFIIHLYNKHYEKFSKIEKENINNAIKFYELSVEKGFHLAIAHIAKKIVQENSNEIALKILKVHEKYIPYIRYSSAEKYHDLLSKLIEK